MRPLSAALAMTLVLVLASAGTSTALAPRAPKVAQVSYIETAESDPPKRLYAFVRRANAVKFRTRYEGRTAKAATRYKTSTTDTDLHGDEVRHPWALIRKNGGRRVLRLVARALKERGMARLRVRAKGDGGVVVARTQIVLSKCSQEPPFYPVDCEVRP